MRIRIPLLVAGMVTLPILAMTCAPHALVGALAAVVPGCTYEFPVAHARARPTVALTIDDAPDPTTTPAILDTLRAHGAHATFFVITDQLRPASGRDPIVERMGREGHEIGNHQTRDRPAIRLDSAEFEADLMRADSVLGAYGPMRWARPGSGWYSRRMIRTMRSAGRECVLGSVYPIDAGLGWPWLSERYVLAHARPGSIIILHDRGRRGSRTAEVLGRVLPVLRARGFDVVTLSELAAVARLLDRGST